MKLLREGVLLITGTILALTILNSGYSAWVVLLWAFFWSLYVWDWVGGGEEK